MKTVQSEVILDRLESDIREINLLKPNHINTKVLDYGSLFGPQAPVMVLERSDVDKGVDVLVYEPSLELSTLYQIESCMANAHNILERIYVDIAVEDLLNTYDPEKLKEHIFKGYPLLTLSVSSDPLRIDSSPDATALRMAWNLISSRGYDINNSKKVSVSGTPHPDGDPFKILVDSAIELLRKSNKEVVKKFLSISNSLDTLREDLKDITAVGVYKIK